MHTALATVRRLVAISTTKQFMPRDARVEAARCEAWFAALAALPGVRPGRLEAAVNGAVEARMVRLLGTVAAASAPANDLHHADAIAL